MKLMIINGPNLNLLGVREPGIYGSSSMESCLRQLRETYGDRVDIEYYQSNHEGDIIDTLHRAGMSGEYAGIVLNAGAYTHTSLAIADAISAIRTPVVEVHISNVHAREPSGTHHSYPRVPSVIAGFGLDSYRLGVEALIHG